jgi:hypothetical protein
MIIVTASKLAKSTESVLLVADEVPIIIDEHSSPEIV